MTDRRVITIEIAEEYAQEAEALGLDVTLASREGLALMVYRKRKGDEWKAEHREATDAYNRWFEDKGSALLDRFKLR